MLTSCQFANKFLQFVHAAGPSVMQQLQERSSCQKRKRERTRLEGKAPTVNVTGEDNMHCASCSHPCN